MELFSSDHFAELRRQAAGATDFAGFWDYFFTDFVEKSGFLAVGHVVAVPGIVAVLGAVAGHMLNQKDPIVPRGLLLMEIPCGIVHGSCLFDGRVGALVYVPAVDVGMLAIMGCQGTMTYSRFVLQSEQEARAAAC